jgi:poly(A) polymerase
MEMMERIIASPEEFYGNDAAIASYLAEEDAPVTLKWAALMHDVGKPATREMQPEGNTRVTFYRHDEVGREIFTAFAERSRWSNAETERTGRLIAMHMHPFHLCNLQRDSGRISRRAAVKLCRRAGDELPGLFLLAMADSLASRGEKKPERMEEELARLYETVRQTYREFIEPVLSGPKLITGRDLIDTFGLAPGPLFAEILAELEVARVEGTVVDRPTALAWVEEFLRRNGPTGPALEP